jgi:hypothetical protein
MANGCDVNPGSSIGVKFLTGGNVGGSLPAFSKGRLRFVRYADGFIILS